ncbi:MAG: hypothetical protein MJ109_00345 [Kiritimatiellae bacterium]|nr:hypothetical protein [Kiritimatiellia bacterium]
MENTNLPEVNLDALAAELPAAFQGHWIADVVRAFGGARAMVSDEELLDYWQEAVVRAMRALTELEGQVEVGDGMRVAYVKRAVRSLLTDLNRKYDVRSEVVSGQCGVVSEEEDEVDLVEKAESSAFELKNRKRIDDFHVALKLVEDDPKCRAYWEAYVRTDGSDRAVGKRLGLSHTAVRKYYRLPFFKAFKEAWELVKVVRG